MSPDKVLHCPECGGLTVKGFCAACRLQVENIKAHKVEQKPVTDWGYVFIRAGGFVAILLIMIILNRCS